jgi:hypothetical protein
MTAQPILRSIISRFLQHQPGLSTMNTPFFTDFLIQSPDLNESTAESSALLPVVQPSAPLSLASRRGFLGASLGSISTAVLPAGLGAWLVTRPEYAQANGLGTAACVMKGVSPYAKGGLVWLSPVSITKAGKDCRWDEIVSNQAIYRIDSHTIKIGELSYFRTNKGKSQQSNQVYENFFTISLDTRSYSIKVLSDRDKVINVITVDSVNNPTTYQDPLSIAASDNAPNDDRGDILRRRTMDDPRVPGQLSQDQINSRILNSLTEIFLSKMRENLRSELPYCTPRMRKWLSLITAGTFNTNILTRHLMTLPSFANVPSFGWRLLIRYREMDPNHYLSMTMVRSTVGGIIGNDYVISFSHIQTANPLQPNPTYLDEFHPIADRDGTENEVDQIFWHYRSAINLLLGITPTYHIYIFSIVQSLFTMLLSLRGTRYFQLGTPISVAVTSLFARLIPRFTQRAEEGSFEDAQAMANSIHALMNGDYTQGLINLVSGLYDAALFQEDDPYTFRFNLQDNNPRHRQLIGYTHDRKDLLPKTEKPVIKPVGACRLCPDKDDDIGGPDAVGRRR